MNDERRRLLTEWLGGCWHEWQNRLCDPNRKCETIPDCKKCGIICKYDGSTDNRTFDTWADLGAVYSKMVERGGWVKFYRYARMFARCAGIYYPPEFFPMWLFCLNHPEHIADRMDLAAEFLEGRDDNR